MIGYDRIKCDFCGVCVSVCPTDAIRLGRMELEIDHEACIECGNCVELCPSCALSEEDEVPTGQPRQA